jgi:hypothetical protein
MGTEGYSNAFRNVRYADSELTKLLNLVSCFRSWVSSSAIVSGRRWMRSDSRASTMANVDEKFRFLRQFLIKTSYEEMVCFQEIQISYLCCLYKEFESFASPLHVIRTEDFLLHPVSDFIGHDARLQEVIGALKLSKITDEIGGFDATEHDSFYHGQRDSYLFRCICEQSAGGWD